MHAFLYCCLFLYVATSLSFAYDGDELDPSTVAFVCPFELNNCGFDIKADNGSTYSWKVGSGFQGNPWTTTGPMVDSTFLSTRGLFSYTDAGSGVLGSKTRMTSPVMSCTGDQCCLEFYYHMFGQGLGTLNVVITQPIFGDTLLATLGGESLGSHWRRYRGTISPLWSTFQFYLEATRSYSSAIMAIDDITVYQQGCPTTVPVYTLPYSCNFTIDMCDMYSTTKDANFSWSYQNGTTLSPNSGPTYDPFGGTYFVYAESATRSRERAVLWTPQIDASQLTASNCIEISFYFHMFGRTMGGLNVRMVAGFNSTLLYTRSGNSGNQWLGGYARAYASSLPANTKTIQFYFEAVNITSPSSNLAISGISIRSITCSNTTCGTETKLRQAMLSRQNNITFTLLPGNSSADCLTTCLTSSDCLAVTYDYAVPNNCTLFLNQSDALVYNVPSAVTVVKTCLGKSTCSVLVYGEYQIDGTYLFDYKPVGNASLTLVANSATATERMCHQACSSRYDCVAVSYFAPYDGICEIYTAQNTTILNGAVQTQVSAKRRVGFPTGCPSAGSGQCGLPPQVPFLGYPSFSSVAVTALATYGCNETYSNFAIGNGSSTCLSNLTWSNPGVCQFEGICNAGLSMLGLDKSPTGVGSLAYVFTSAKFACSGIVSRWQMYVRNVDVPVYFDVWAPQATSNVFLLIGTQKFIPSVPGLQYFTPTTQIRVFPGYMIGYHYESNAIPADSLVIPHADTANPFPWSASQLMDTSSAFYTHANFTIGGTLQFLTASKASRIPALRAFVINPTACSANPATPGGQVVSRTQSNAVGSVATFQCRGNYIMSGSATSTCQVDGTWSTPPACTHPGQTSGCGTPPGVLSGTPVYTSTSVGSTVTYTCSQGFASGVVSSATCQPDQAWGPDIPTCDVAESCAVGPTVLDSSSFSQPNSLWLVIFNSPFSCTGRLRRWTYWSMQGGILVHLGVFATTGAATGQVAWTLIDYTNVTTKGTNNLETYDIPDTKVFNVTAGQFMGIFYPNPNANGAVGAIPTGTAANLGPYSTSDLANAWIYPYGFSDIVGASRVQFTASSYNANYRVYPVRASVTVPPTQCSPPSPIANGKVTYTALAVGNSATYTCDNNYVMIGQATVMCQSLGYWSPAVPVCETPDLCAVGVVGMQASGLLLATNLRIFSDMAFRCSGELRRWKFYAQVANVKVHLAVWRQNTTSPNTWYLMGYNDYMAPSIGAVTYDVPSTQRILVKAGDAIGVHYDSPYFGTANAVISLFADSGAKGYEIALGDPDIVNKAVTFTGQVTSNFYVPSVYASVVVTGGCSPAPTPLNGRVWQANSTYAVYSCANNYKMVGLTTSTCSISGTWPPAPFCVGQGGCVAGLSTLGNNTVPFSTMSAMLHIFTTMAFPCSGKVIGWAFVSTSYDHVVYLSAWRNMGSSNYKLIGYNKIWATQSGYNYITVNSLEQFTVTTGDMLGIFYQSSQMPLELLVIPYAGNLEMMRGIITKLESGYMVSYGLKQLATISNNTINLASNTVQVRWRTPQVQAIIQS